MKKLIFILLSAMAITTAEAQQRGVKDLVGKWMAVDSENATGGLEITDSSHVYLIYEGKKKPLSDYKFDFTKSPAWFDFTVQEEASGMKLKSLLQFVNDDLIQWQVFEDGVRPAFFSSNSGDVVYLRRMKQ